MKSNNYEGNTAFFDGDFKDDKFYVERVFYDSPREDCSGYYSDVYEYDTPKQAYKAMQRINRSEEPEGANTCLRSGKPRVYYLTNTDGSVYKRYTDYGEFEKERKFWLKLFCETKRPEFRLQIKIA